MTEPPNHPPFPPAALALTGRCQVLYTGLWQTLDRNDLKSAVAAAHALSVEFPRFAEGWYAGSIVAVQTRKWQQALDSIERALQLKSDNVMFLAHKATCLVNADRTLEALALAEALGDKANGDATVLAGLGAVFAACGDHGQAAVFHDRAAVVQPDNAQHFLNLAAAQRLGGDSEGAEASYDTGLRLHPHDYEAQMARSDLRRQSRGRNHIGDLGQALVEAAESWRAEVKLCFALAKEYDDLGEYDRAMEYLTRGARQKKAHLQYHLQKDLGVIDKIMATFDRDFFASETQGFESDAPIFLLGLPLAGTSVLRGTLSAHPDVCVMRDANTFATETSLMVGRSGEEVSSKAELIATAARLNFRRLGMNYIEAARKRCPHGSRFISMLPLNYLYLGLIAAALPNAKLVELVRAPEDACFSVYRKLFKRAYPFSYDLSDLGVYFDAYRRLSDHWQQVLPGRIFRLSYESLQQSRAEELSGLFRFCDLDYPQADLAADERRRFTATARAARMGFPLSELPIGHWRHYQGHLKPLLERL